MSDKSFKHAIVDALENLNTKMETLYREQLNNPNLTPEKRAFIEEMLAKSEQGHLEVLDTPEGERITWIAGEARPL